MKATVLADTGPLYAAVDPDDQHHARAQQELRRLEREGLTVAVACPILAECLYPYSASDGTQRGAQVAQRNPRRLHVIITYANPDLAAEVVSGSDTFGDIDAKVQQYLDSGVRLVWLIDPVMRTVTAYAPNARPRLFTDADDLAGDPVLPGLRIPVGQIFP